MSFDNPCFEQLQQIQNENAALQERIAELRRSKYVPEETADEEQSEEYKLEIEATLEKIKEEEVEIRKLKRELAELNKEQLKLQNQIEDHNRSVFNTLTPQEKIEQELTNKFYADLIQKLEEKNLDSSRFKQLLETLTQKRHVVAEKTEKQQKLHRLITFHQKQNILCDENQDTRQGMMAKKFKSVNFIPQQSIIPPVEEPSLATENPLPCMSGNCGTRRGSGRNRVRFASQPQ